MAGKSTPVCQNSHRTELPGLALLLCFWSSHHFWSKPVSHPWGLLAATQGRRPVFACVLVGPALAMRTLVLLQGQWEQTEDAARCLNRQGRRARQQEPRAAPPYPPAPGCRNHIFPWSKSKKTVFVCCHPGAQQDLEPKCQCPKSLTRLRSTKALCVLWWGSWCLSAWERGGAKGGEKHGSPLCGGIFVGALQHTHTQSPHIYGPI